MYEHEDCSTFIDPVWDPIVYLILLTIKCLLLIQIAIGIIKYYVVIFDIHLKEKRERERGGEED